MASILLIGADREQTHGLRVLLREDGHSVTCVSEVDRWREGERKSLPELIVAALPRPEPVLSLRDRRAAGFPAPILLVQSDDDLSRDLHLDDRLVDRIASPFMAEEFLARADALVRMRRVVLRRGGLRNGLGLGRAGADREGTRTGWGSRIAALLGSRIPRYDKPQGPYYEVASRAAEWADRRDTFEPGHAERVSSFSSMIAEVLGLPDGEAATLLRAAMLHDIGKIAMPVEVLRQREPLEEDQLRLMRTHPERGAALLRALDKDEAVAEAVLLHHERVDGSGYYGKRNAEIPRAARILAVAEAYDAMTTTRVRDPLPSDTALAILKDRREHYDGACVAALADSLRPRAPVQLSVARWP